MKNKIAGYIVIDNECLPYRLGDGCEFTAGVLWFRDGATFFPTRKAARAAIKATLAYSNANGLEWKISEYEIMTVYHAPVE